MKRDKTDSPHNNYVAAIGIAILVIGIAATLWVISIIEEPIEVAPPTDDVVPSTTAPADN